LGTTCHRRLSACLPLTCHCGFAGCPAIPHHHLVGGFTTSHCPPPSTTILTIHTFLSCIAWDSGWDTFSTATTSGTCLQDSLEGAVSAPADYQATPPPPCRATATTIPPVTTCIPPTCWDRTISLPAPAWNLRYTARWVSASGACHLPGMPATTCSPVLTFRVGTVCRTGSPALQDYARFCLCGCRLARCHAACAQQPHRHMPFCRRGVHLMLAPYGAVTARLRACLLNRLNACAARRLRLLGCTLPRRCRLWVPDAGIPLVPGCLRRRLPDRLPRGCLRAVFAQHSDSAACATASRACQSCHHRRLHAPRVGCLCWIAACCHAICRTATCHTAACTRLALPPDTACHYGLYYLEVLVQVSGTPAAASECRSYRLAPLAPATSLPPCLPAAATARQPAGPHYLPPGSATGAGMYIYYRQHRFCHLWTAIGVRLFYLRRCSMPLRPA